MGYKKGQLSADFYIALVVFLGFLAYITFQLFQIVPESSASVREETIRIEAYQLSELLINDGGHPNDWETRSSTDIKRIGLSDATKNVANFLLRSKVEKFKTVCDHSWTQATADSGWGFVQGQTALTFNNKMWVIGAESAPSTFGDDVWSSSDGVTWVLETKVAGWSPRYLQTALAFNNKMWVIGGLGQDGFLNDVWSSTDGVTWVLETKVAGWSPRYLHRSVVFNNMMWVIGGRTTEGGNVKNVADVWSSSDGANWNLVTSNAAFGPIEFHSALVFNNKMWVIVADRRVWSSSDGANWNLATSNGPPAQLDYVTVFDNKIWVMGRSGDVWSSTDGITWNQITLSAPWAPRAEHSVIVLNNKIWLIGGVREFRMLNDVWSSEGYGFHKIRELLDLDKSLEYSITITEHKTTGDETEICKSNIPTAKKTSFNVGRTVLISGTSHTSEIIVEVWRR